MDRDQALQAITEALHRIAPEADLAVVDAHADLAEELDLDSMDLLELQAALAERTGVDLGSPEVAGDADLSTLDGLVSALASS